jgi:predicted nucleotidyltransferase
MTKIERKVIQLLSDYPEREFYGQEISKKIRCSKASVSGILKSLSQKKIVEKKIKGRMKFYQINTKSAEVKKFKIDLVLEKINPLLPKLQKVSQKVVLFGSASRGEQTVGSDIDLFLISCEKSEARTLLKKIASGLPIKAIMKTPGEWSEMEVDEPEFYQEIKNGITLYNYVPRI